MGPAPTLPPASLDTAWEWQDGARESCALLTGGITAPYLRRVPCPEPQGAEAALQQ